MHPPLSERVLRDQHTYRARKEIAPGITLSLLYVSADDPDVERHHRAAHVGKPFWAMLRSGHEQLEQNIARFASFDAMMQAVSVPASDFVVERRYVWDEESEWMADQMEKARESRRAGHAGR